MQRRLFITALAASPLAARAANLPLRIGTTPGPHAEILEQVRRTAATRGLDLQPVLRENGHGINADVARGTLDAACFEDGVRFAQDTLHRRGQLVDVAATVTLPMALYSRRLTAPAQLRHGDAVAVPADPHDLARALVLLHNHGLIELREGRGLQAGLRDIAANRRQLRIEPLPAPRLFDALNRVPLAVIDSPTATAAGLQPARDSIGLEDARSPYAGVLVVRHDHAQAAWLPPLLAAYRSEDTKRFLLERFHDSVRRPW